MSSGLLQTVVGIDDLIGRMCWSLRLEDWSICLRMVGYNLGSRSSVREEETVF